MVLPVKVDYRIPIPDIISEPGWFVQMDRRSAIQNALLHIDDKGILRCFDGGCLGVVGFNTLQRFLAPGDARPGLCFNKIPWHAAVSNRQDAEGQAGIPPCAYLENLPTAMV